MAKFSNPRAGVWIKAVNKVRKAVFRVEIDNAGGTAFAISSTHNEAGTSYALMLATAWHVIRDCGLTSHVRLVSADERYDFDNRNLTIKLFPPNTELLDIGLITVQSTTQFFDPGDVVPLLPHPYVGAIGADLGWLGFPSVAWPQLCFFRGSLSGYLPTPVAYLVDGVAINGVSGGPAFNDEGIVFGIVQSYLPNRLSDDMTLPGLMEAVPIFPLEAWMSESLKTIGIP